MIKSNDLEHFQKKIIENKLISIISAVDHYRVLERTDLPAIISEHEFANFYSDDENNKPMEFLSSEEILLCNIYYSDNSYFINLKIESVDSGEILTSADTVTDSSLTDIINSLPSATLELLKKQLSIESLSIKSSSFNVPVRDFDKKNVSGVNINNSIRFSSIENIFMNDKDLFVVENPLKISVLTNFLSKKYPPNTIFDYKGWEVSSSSYSNKNNVFSVGLSNGLVCIWDTRLWGNPYQINVSKEKITVIDNSVSDAIVYAGNVKGQLFIIDSNSLTVQESINISNHELVFIRSINGGLIIIDKQMNIFLYKYENNQIVAKLNNFDLSFSCANLMSNNKVLAIGLKNGLVKLYEISNNLDYVYSENGWEKPYVRFYHSFDVSQSVSYIDFTPANDVLGIVLGNGSLNFIHLLSQKNIVTKDNKIPYQYIQFVDNFQFIKISANGNLELSTIR